MLLSTNKDRERERTQAEITGHQESESTYMSENDKR